MPLNIDKKIVFIEYLGNNKNIVDLEGYNNIKQIIAIDSTGFNPISWTSGEPEELQGFSSLEKFQGYLIESKQGTVFPYVLYSESDSAQSEKIITKKFQIARYSGAETNVSSSSLANKVRVIYRIDNINGESVPKTWTPGEDDSLQGFTKLENNEVYFIESKQDSLPYTFWSTPSVTPTPTPTKIGTIKTVTASIDSGMGTDTPSGQLEYYGEQFGVYYQSPYQNSSLEYTELLSGDTTIVFANIRLNGQYFGNVSFQRRNIGYSLKIYANCKIYSGVWAEGLIELTLTGDDPSCSPTPTPTSFIRTVVASIESDMGNDTPSGGPEYYGEGVGVYYQSPYLNSKLEYTEIGSGDTTITFATINYDGQYFGNVSFQKKFVGGNIKIYANCKIYNGTWTEGTINLTLFGNDPSCLVTPTPSVSIKTIVASIDSEMGNDTPSGSTEYYGEGTGVYYQSPYQNSKLEYNDYSGGDTTITFATINYEGQYFGNVSFQKKFVGGNIKIYANCKVYNGTWAEGTINLTLFGNDPSCLPTPTPSTSVRSITASSDSGMGNDTPSGSIEYYGEATGVYYQSPYQNSVIEYNEYSGGDTTIVFATLNYKVANVQYLGNVSFQKKYLGSSLKIYANCKVYKGTWSEGTIDLLIYGKDPNCPDIECNFLECNPNINFAVHADCGLIFEPGYRFEMNCDICECVRIANNPTPTPTPTINLALTPTPTPTINLALTPTPTPTVTPSLATIEIIANNLASLGNDTPSGTPEYYAEAVGIYFQTPNQESKLIYKNLSNIGGGTQILFSTLNFNSIYFANMSFQAKYVGQEFKIIHNCQVYSVIMSSNTTHNLTLTGQDPNCAN